MVETKGRRGCVAWEGWELWVREFEIMKGRASEEDTKICSLYTLIPEEVKVALDDKPEHPSFASRLAIVKRRLGMEKHRALAQLTSSQATVKPRIATTEACTGRAPRRSPRNAARALRARTA